MVRKVKAGADVVDNKVLDVTREWEADVEMEEKDVVWKELPGGQIRQASGP